MGKVRVTDLARKIGMAEQDLLFKLRSIGVRIEGDDPQVDTDVLKAVFEGKRLATPREVIVRDEDATRHFEAAREQNQRLGAVVWIERRSYRSA